MTESSVEKKLLKAALALGKVTEALLMHHMHGDGGVIDSLMVFCDEDTAEALFEIAPNVDTETITFGRPYVMINGVTIQ